MRASNLRRAIIAIALLSTTCLTSLAQSFEKTISPFRFSGVHSLSNRSGETAGYVALHGLSGGNYNYQLLNTELEEVNEGEIEAPRFTVFNNLAFSNGFSLLSFINNSFSTSITYALINGEGNLVNSITRTETPMLRRGEQYFPSVYAHPSKGFFIVQTSKDGYTLEQVDYTLNTIWSMEFVSQRGHAHVFDLLATTDKVYVLEAAEKLGFVQGSRVHCVSVTDQKLVYTTELSTTKESFYPTAIVPLADSGIALTGTYFKGKRISIKNADGLFFINLGADGSRVSEMLHPWKGLKASFKTSIPFWFKTMPDVYTHALEPNPDGTFTAIAELYRYSGETGKEVNGEVKEQYHRIRMLDFMLITYSGKGEIIQTERIERPHMSLKIQSGMGETNTLITKNISSGELKRARAMKRANAFTYRFHQRTETNFNLAFVNYEEKVHCAYLMDLNNNKNGVVVDLTHAKPQLVSYMQIASMCANQSVIGFMLGDQNTRSFDYNEAYFRGVLPAKENNMLTYEYMPISGKLKVKLVELPYNNVAVR